MSLVIKKYPDLGPVHLFYGGSERLRFCESKWLWLREQPEGLQPLDGVTTVLKFTHNAAEPLINWAMKKAFEKFRRLCIEKHLGPNDAFELFVPEMDALIVEAKKAAKENLEDAGDVGTQAHEHLEKIAKATMGKDYPRLEELIALMPTDERAESCVTAAVLWCVEHDIEWIASERTVYHIDIGVCGTMDNLAWASSCQNPACCPVPFTRRRVQIDYKSSNALRVEYCLQTGLYTAAWEREFPEQSIEDRFILRLDKETAAFEAWHFEGRELQEQDYQAYLNALTHYRSFRAVEKRISAVRDTKRMQKKEDKMTEKVKGLAQRFWEKVDKNGPTPAHCPELGSCWLWTGAFYKKGPNKTYGVIGANIDGVKNTGAHRTAWYLETGKWPEPCALHKCDNSSCVRFSHLYEGTVQENNAEMIAKGRFKPGPGKPFEEGHPYYPSK